MRCVAILLSLAVASAALGQSPSPYSITQTYTLGGEGGWDYIVPDPPAIACTSRARTRDGRRRGHGKLLGEVTGINGAHGTAIVADTGHGFATSGDDKSVVMFDLEEFKELGRIPAAEDADAIIYDAASKRVFSFNGDANSSTVIEPRERDTLITNIALGGKPEYGASAGDGKVYVNLIDKSEVVEIDANGATVVRRWSTAPCKQPVAMAIDTAHGGSSAAAAAACWRCRTTQAGKVVATAPIGMGVDGAGYDPATARRVRVERGRHADGDPRGFARQVHRRAEPRDFAGGRATWVSIRRRTGSSS